MEEDNSDINFKIEINSVGVIKGCGWDFVDATLPANQVQLFMDLTHHLFHTTSLSVNHRLTGIRLHDLEPSLLR
jgi:hypothetical protein